MPRVCTICSHPDRETIDAAILAGELSNRRIASQYDVSERAVRHHRREHLSERMAGAAERNAEADVRTAIDVVSQLKLVNTEAHAVLQTAKANGDGGLTLQAIDRITKQIELQAKLIDLLSDGTTVNVTVSPQWMQIRALITSALQAHPEARQAVATALQGIEGGASHARAA